MRGGIFMKLLYCKGTAENVMCDVIKIIYYPSIFRGFISHFSCINVTHDTFCCPDCKDFAHLPNILLCPFVLQLQFYFVLDFFICMCFATHECCHPCYLLITEKGIMGLNSLLIPCKIYLSKTLECNQSLDNAGLLVIKNQGISTLSVGLYGCHDQL